MKQLAAVLGVGQTRHRSKRTDVSIAGLCREAADRAIEDAGLSLTDIDAVVVGKAPDLFEGVMMPELYLADALGAVGKPLLRVHTAGSVGGATGLVATSLVQSGVHRRVLAVAFEKQSESNAMWALSITPPFSLPVVAPSDRRVRPAAVRRGGAAGDGPSGRAPRSVTPTAARSSSPCGVSSTPPYVIGCSEIRRWTLSRLAHGVGRTCRSGYQRCVRSRRSVLR